MQRPAPALRQSPHAVRPGLRRVSAQPRLALPRSNAITSTWPAQTGAFLADLSRAGNTVATGDAGSAAQLEAQDAENAADIAAVAAGCDDGQCVGSAPILRFCWNRILTDQGRGPSWTR